MARKTLVRQSQLLLRRCVGLTRATLPVIRTTIPLLWWVVRAAAFTSNGRRTPRNLLTAFTLPRTNSTGAAIGSADVRSPMVLEIRYVPSAIRSRLSAVRKLGLPVASDLPNTELLALIRPMS